MADSDPYDGPHADGRPRLDDALSQQSLAASIMSGEDSVVPDIQMLNLHCARAFPPRNNTPEAKEEAAASWDAVREWLRTRSAEEVRAAAEQRGDSAMTALHFACRNAPPTDVIDVFLSIAEDTVQWPDSFGWLPIHYACACGAETEVIKQLAEAFPESKTTVDRRGRTPLHFALGNSSKPVAPDVVVLLSGSGAAGYADDNGMLVSLQKEKKVLPVLHLSLLNSQVLDYFVFLVSIYLLFICLATSLRMCLRSQ
jgi:Ankyrin repeats (3 copies)